jgi:hypothetical protein
MRILFLDIDGVLNTFQTSEIGPGGSIGIDKDKAELIVYIVKKAKCSIVVTSSWRSDFQQCVYLFQKVLVNPENWIGYTPILSNTPRFQEINMFLQSVKYNIGSFVILDDMKNMGNLQNRLIETDPRIGLTSQLANNVINLLNN